MIDDPYKLPLPTIPRNTIAVNGTPHSAKGVLPLPQRRNKYAATAEAAAPWWQHGSSGGESTAVAAAASLVRRRLWWWRQHSGIIGGSTVARSVVAAWRRRQRRRAACWQHDGGRHGRGSRRHRLGLILGGTLFYARVTFETLVVFNFKVP